MILLSNDLQHHTMGLAASDSENKWIGRSTRLMQGHICSSPMVKYFFVLLVGLTTRAHGQLIFRSKADSTKYFQTIGQMADEHRNDIDDLFLLAESYLVKEIFNNGYYCSYKDLLKSNRRDTILHIGLFCPGY